MNLKQRLLIIGFLVAIAVGVLAKWAIAPMLSQQPVKMSSVITNADDTETAIAVDDVNADVAEKQHQFKITFPDALAIAETTVDGKAYSMERETEAGQPVIEVGIAGKEVFVQAENGEIVAIDDAQQKGDREDIEEITEFLNLQPLATITLEQALQSVEAAVGGQIHTVELENEDGNLVYKVVIELQEIYVDAGNGQILYTASVEADDDRDATHPASSIQVPPSDEEEP